MKYTKRKCFETNSSSMHSIVITKSDGKSETEDIYSNKILDLRYDDLSFGRYPFQILRTFKQKVGYAIASFGNCYIQNDNDSQKIEEIREIVKKELNLELRLPMRTDEEYRIADSGKTIPVYDIEWIEDPDDSTKEICIYKPDPSVDIEYREYELINANVDHQSSGLLQTFLEKYNVTLEEFLTNSKYIVIIDGDEYCEFDNLYMSGIINTDNIEEQFPKRMSFDSWEYAERKKI